MIMIQPKGTFLSTYIYPRTSDKQVNVNTDRIVIARRLIIRLQLLDCVVDPCYLAVLRRSSLSCRFRHRLVGITTSTTLFARHNPWPALSTRPKTKFGLWCPKCQMAWSTAILQHRSFYMNGWSQAARFPAISLPVSSTCMKHLHVRLIYSTGTHVLLSFLHRRSRS